MTFDRSGDGAAPQVPDLRDFSSEVGREEGGHEQLYLVT